MRRARQAWQVSGHHPRPHAGEAVAELDRGAEVGGAPFGGHAEGGGELEDGELQDPGGARPGERLDGVAEHRLGGVEGVLGVHGRPLGGGLEDVGLGGVRGSTSVAQEPEDLDRRVGGQRGRRSVVEGGVPREVRHGSTQAGTTDRNPSRSGGFHSRERQCSIRISGLVSGRDHEGRVAPAGGRRRRGLDRLDRRGTAAAWSRRGSTDGVRRRRGLDGLDRRGTAAASSGQADLTGYGGGVVSTGSTDGVRRRRRARRARPTGYGGGVVSTRLDRRRTASTDGVRPHRRRTRSVVDSRAVDYLADTYPVGVMTRMTELKVSAMRRRPAASTVRPRGL